MMRINGFMMAIFVTLVTGSFAAADLITRVGAGMAPPSFAANTGVYSIPIDVVATNAEVGVGFTVYVTDFSITPTAGGANIIGTLGPTTYGLTGYFGEGKLEIGLATYFNRTSPTTAQLSLFLNLPTPEFGSATYKPIALLQIDTTNVPEGTYTITASPLGVQDGQGTMYPVGKIDGSFTIVGVPEPTSVLLVGFGCAVACLSRRRRAFV